MNNKLIFLRHAPTIIDQDIPSDRWGIKPESIDTLTALSTLSDFQNIDLIYSSTKNRAVLTAGFFANKNNVNIIQVEELAEINKPGADKLPPEDYQQLKLQIFSDFDFSANNSETANQALIRFAQAIDVIDSSNIGKNILIVSHGITMSLYFAQLQSQLSDILSRWDKFKFSNYGVVLNGNVVRDIV